MFFAIFPPPAVAERLARVARAQAAASGGRATRVETIHLTLAFLGDVDDDKLDSLLELARGVRAPAFDLVVDFCGHWRHNRLVWAGVSSPPPGLLEFAGGLRRTLAGAGFIVDRGAGEGSFTPHVTLVRRTDAAATPPNAPIAEPVVWPCRDFALVRSRVDSGGSQYARVASFALARPAAG